MQVRFREYDEDAKKYKLIAYDEVEDYDTMFKTLTFMKEHKCEYALEVNEQNAVETEGTLYEIEQVSLCVSRHGGEDSILPHFVVDVREAF